MRIQELVVAYWLMLAASHAMADTVDEQARAEVAKMSREEIGQLLHGPMALPLAGRPAPEDAVLGAGFIHGVPRLRIPNLTETDASLGVSYVGGARHDGATALPSGMAMGSTWDPDLVRRGGELIGSEASAKGFNVMLAGGANLIRDPRNGRTFEYLSEDPLLTGKLVGAAIQGIQSNHIVSTIKHFALNDQETGRKGVDVRISDAAARESDLLAFEIGIEIGQPGSVMCSYNLVNGSHACDSDYLLNKVLKQDWGYPGWVMSDWGAVTSTTQALHGLDQQSGEQLDKEAYFDKPLSALAAKDPVAARRTVDMATRIVRSLYSVGLNRDGPAKRAIDLEQNARVAEDIESEGIVLLQNNGILPLKKNSHQKIVVIGGYADTGVLSGGGSSQTQGQGGPGGTVPHGGDSPFASFLAEAYQRSNPLAAIKAAMPSAQVAFREGRYLSEAVSSARAADLAIVFATQWMTEGFDVPDLSLPNGQDALIEAIASANKNTVVVLETGGPVLLPWLERTAAVLEAWYPGARGAQAVGSVLVGETNPSGRLPVTFPAAISDLPRPVLSGLGTIEPNFVGDTQGKILTVDYNVEGSDVGYRYFVRQGSKTLYPFGYGLSYTRFSASGLSVNARGSALRAKVTVENTGTVSGAQIAQIYLTSRHGVPTRRLAAFGRVPLAPGERKEIVLDIDPRILADWTATKWQIAPGDYRFSYGENAESLSLEAIAKLKGFDLQP